MTPSNRIAVDVALMVAASSPNPYRCGGDNTGTACRRAEMKRIKEVEARINAALKAWLKREVAK